MVFRLVKALQLFSTEKIMTSSYFMCGATRIKLHLKISLKTYSPKLSSLKLVDIDKIVVYIMSTQYNTERALFILFCLPGLFITLSHGQMTHRTNFRKLP